MKKEHLAAFTYTTNSDLIRTVYLRPQLIARIEVAEDGSVTIHMDTGHTYNVHQQLDEVFQLLGEAQRSLAETVYEKLDAAFERGLGSAPKPDAVTTPAGPVN